MSKKSPLRGHKTHKERRKHPRSARSLSSKSKRKQTIYCFSCDRKLTAQERILYVEEEINRYFCSESCIAEYFKPEIEAMEKAHQQKVQVDDLTPEERQNLSHLQWITLEEPDEIWCSSPPSGDLYYCLISEFDQAGEKIWYVCLTLMLRGEPSFLFLAFPTRKRALVDFYRREKRIRISEKKKPSDEQTDSVAEQWTEQESMLATLDYKRSKTDIPAEEFGQYESKLPETLENPDELWNTTFVQGMKTGKLFHFIKNYHENDEKLWFIVVARMIEGSTELEVIEYFPTRDQKLVQQCRLGKTELTGQEIPDEVGSRIIH